MEIDQLLPMDGVVSCCMSLLKEIEAHQSVLPVLGFPNPSKFHQ